MNSIKKTIFKIAFLTCISISILSCNNDDDSGPSFQEENFLDGYLSTIGFDQKVTDLTNTGAANFYEFGLEFTPLVKGSITSLQVKLPDANPSLRITIWEKGTPSILKTEIVNVVSANTVYTVDIVDLPLVKDKEYAITMNSNDWYRREKTDGSDAVYPVSIGNIKINKFMVSGVSTAQEYPSLVGLNRYSGDLSFNFLQQK